MAAHEPYGDTSEFEVENQFLQVHSVMRSNIFQNPMQRACLQRTVIGYRDMMLGALLRRIAHVRTLGPCKGVSQLAERRPSCRPETSRGNFIALGLHRERNEAG